MARLPMAEKKDDAITVKMPEEMARMVRLRAAQLGIDGASEYIRNLVKADIEQARSDYQALACIFGDRAVSAQENFD